MLPPSLLSALRGPSFSLAELRSQTPLIIVGFILLAVGMAALTLFFVRRKSRDLTLIYFSIFSILYAVRLLLRMQVVRSLTDVSGSFADHLNLWITFTLLIPFLLFLRQVLGPQTKALLNRLLIAAVIFAVVSITADVIGIRGSFAFSLNNYLVLAIVGGLTTNLIVLRSRGLGQPWTGEYRVLTVGLAVFGAFVLQGNLASLGLGRGGPNEEVLGFLFFVGCLGYVAAHRTFANEHRLLAIDKELEIARHIQSSILPRAVPSIAGLEIAARYLPMSAVAGDFYDFFAPGNNQLGILVADVTGHGVPAALIASMLKGAFAGQKAHVQHPELVLVGLNRGSLRKIRRPLRHCSLSVRRSRCQRSSVIGSGTSSALCVSSRLNGERRSVEQNGVLPGHVSRSCLHIDRNPAATRRSLCALHRRPARIHKR